MARILLLDPSLMDEKSHHYSAAAALLHEASALRMQCRLLCNRDASDAVKRLPAIPLFTLGGYFGEPDAPAAFRTTSCANATILLDLVKLNEQLQRDDFVLFPTVTANMILAICQWIAGFPQVDRPGFGLCLMFPPNWHHSGQLSDVPRQFFDAGFAMLKPEHKQRIVLTCETQSLAQTYQHLLGIAPLVMPVPLDTADTPRAVARSPQAPTVTYVGYAKREKGTHLLPDIVTAVRGRCPQVRFEIQLMAHNDELIDTVRAGLAAHADVVTIVEGPLSRADYRDLVCRGSLILMPYDSRTYQDRGSGVYTDARSFGVPVIAPAGTAIASDALQLGMAATFDEFTAASVAEAIVAAVARLPQLDAAAMRASAAQPVGYLKALLERFERGAVTDTREA